MIRVFIASSSGFVAVSTAGAGSGAGSGLRGSRAPGAGPAGGAPRSPLRVSVRSASGRGNPHRAGDPSHLHNNEKGGEQRWVGDPSSPTGPARETALRENGVRRQPPAPGVWLRNLGKGESESPGGPVSLSVSSSRFGTFSLVIFCINSFYLGCLAT